MLGFRHKDTKAQTGTKGRRKKKESLVLLSVFVSLWQKNYY